MDFSKCLDYAGLNPDSYEVVEEGNIVNTAILREGDEKTVFQYVEGAGIGNFNRGSKAYGWLENSDVNVPERLDYELRYDFDYSWHRVEFIDGGEPESSEDFYRVGKSLAELHETFKDSDATVGRVSGEPDQELEDWGERSWNSFFNQQLSKSIREVEGTRYEVDVIETLKRNREKYPLLEDTEITFLHGDVSPENVIMSDGEVYWIDFDQALFGDPDYEFFRAEQRFKLHDADTESFSEGYREVRDFKGEPYHKLYGALGVTKLLQAFKRLEERGKNSLSDEQLSELNRELEELEVEDTPEIFL